MLLIKVKPNIPSIPNEQSTVPIKDARKLRVQFPFWEIINVPNLTTPNNFCSQPLIMLKFMFP